jgi:hypothetical protein
VSFFINEATKMVEVEFRLSTDSDSEIRIDNFDIDTIEEYGYTVYSDEYDVFDVINLDYSDEDLEDIEESSIYEISEEDLYSFMGEYYSLHRNKIPDIENF